MPDYWSGEYVPASVHVDLKNETKGNSFREFRDKLIQNGWGADPKTTKLIYSIYVVINGDTEAIEQFQNQKITRPKDMADAIASFYLHALKDFAKDGVIEANKLVMGSIEPLRELDEQLEAERVRKQQVLESASFSTYMDRFQIDEFIDANSDYSIDTMRVAGFIQSQNPLPERRPQMTTAFLIWCLGRKEMTLQELSELFALRPEEKKALGKEFLEDLWKHPVSSHYYNRSQATYTQMQENQAWYGELFAKAFGKLKETQITFPEQKDYADPEAMKKLGQSEFMLAVYLGKNLPKLMASRTSGSQLQQVIKGWGGSVAYSRDMNMLAAAQSMGAPLLTEGDEIAQQYQTMIAKHVAAPVFGGKPLSHAAGEDKAFQGIMANAQTQAVLDGKLGRRDQMPLQLGDGSKDIPLEKVVEEAFTKDELERNWIGDIARRQVIQGYAKTAMDSVKPVELEAFLIKKPFELKSLSEEELKKASDRFDKLFSDLRARENGLLQKANKADISGNFVCGGMSVSSYVSEVMKDRNLTPEQKASYEKAYILHAIGHRGDRDLVPVYHPLEIRVDAAENAKEKNVRVTTAADLEEHSYMYTDFPYSINVYIYSSNTNFALYRDNNLVEEFV
ncbi:MAG: hypothetical protein IKS07_08475, partial [Lachnospiraceae bacterium]|nr:hypothetical protein [Lachnospiraceae bacterium]